MSAERPDDLDRGAANRRAMLGDAWVERSLGQANSLNAEFQSQVTRHAWHDIWGRPGLDAQTRRLLVLGMTMGLARWEVFELHCSLQSAESVTHDCYKIYDQLTAKARSDDDRALAQEVLRLAGECHEIKKNHQRIFAGLQELTNNRHVDDYLPPDQITRLLVHTQQKYARSLNKDINFQVTVPKRLPPLHVFLLLSILNNLVANAVEAIEHHGTISIEITGGNGDDLLHIHLSNTGSFIPARRLTQVFSPGYTTKFDSTGKASSGVGLSYVQHQTEALGGSITMDSDGKDSVTCEIHLPCHKLHKKNDTETKGSTL